MNKLFYGDNLDVLRRHVADASVDLVYLDPPFQSGRDYNLVLEAKGGEHEDTRAQREAFQDTWSWGPRAEASYAEAEGIGGSPAATIRALRALLGGSDLMAYLCMMAPRLVELRRVLKRTGSLYLHCDPTASHYLKVLMDGIFGPRCFRNEVVWRYRRWPARAARYQRMHDILLFYTASDDKQHVWSTLYGYEKLAESTRKTFGTKKQRADFSSGHRKPSVEDQETEGPPLSDVWEVGVIAAIGKERTGYPTQKPEALLERVILASSNEGGIVLDPFCGCGTTMAVAERLHRRWIGIDATQLAINIARGRLRHADFEVLGEPVDLDGLRKLAEADRSELTWWLLGRVEARPSDRKTGTDLGIDGELFFLDQPSGGTKGETNRRVILSVEAGKAEPGRVRELLGVLDREQAALGVLLTLEEPTAAVRREAAAAGSYESRWGTGHPRIQIVTAADILDGRGIDYPGANVTARRAARKARPHEQMVIPGLASPADAARKTT